MNKDFTTAQASTKEKIKGRQSIALDMNIWNFLARETSDAAKQVKVLLQRLVAEEKVFCPVSFSLIAELFKQNYESALRTGTLMEELSLNTAFALDDEIYTREVRHFIGSFTVETNGEVERMNDEEVYVPVGGFVGTNYDDVISELEKLPLPEMFRDVISNKLEATIATLTITGLIEKFKAILPITELIAMSPPPKYMTMWRDRWEDSKGNKDKMRQIELEFFINDVLLPKLMEEKNTFPDETRRRFIEYVRSLPQNNKPLAWKTIIKKFPAMRNAVEIMTITGYDPNRKTNMNDFFDTLNMSAPFAYAGVLVASDKWIKQVLSNRTKSADDKHALYFSRLEDFEVYLKELR